MQVAETDGLPSNICYRCINRIDIYTEYRDKCIENDKILRDLLKNNTIATEIGKYIKKEIIDDESIEFDTQHINEGASIIASSAPNNQNDLRLMERQAQDRREMYMEDIKGETQFYPDENSLVMVVDPTKYYDSSEQSANENSDNEIERKFIGETVKMRGAATNVLRDVFLCKYCDLAFTKSDICQNHELNEHNSMLPHKCNFCPFQVDNRNSVILHIKEYHNTDKPFVCVQCMKGFGRRSDLKKHTVCHTGVRPFMCPVCNKNFSRNTNLTKHMRIHSGDKPHVCSLCPRSFVTKGDLYRHQQIHSESRPFQCTKCSANFTRKDKLHQHEKIHFRKEEQNMTNSLLQDQLQQQQQPQQHESESMVIALDPFPNLDQTQNELEDDEVISPQKSDGFSVPDHIQNLDLVFPNHITGDVVTFHDLEQPLDQQIRGFSCNTCPKRFATKTSLQNHQNIHLGIRNHICMICNKAFLRKRELDRHSVVHTGFKPFQCSVCFKRFGRKDKLVRHERIHSIDRIFSCNLCQQSFARRDGLLLHMKIHERELAEFEAKEKVQNIENNDEIFQTDMEQLVENIKTEIEDF